MGYSKPLQLLEPSLRRGNLLFDLPIAQRLTLGFLAAALITTLGAGITGVLRTQSLHKESSFYQNLLRTSTTLTVGENLLDLMSNLAHSTLDSTTPLINSHETLLDNQQALSSLIKRYDATLTDFVAHDLVNQYPEQVMLLENAGHGAQVLQQRVLFDSTLREWRVHRGALEYFLLMMRKADFSTAQTLIRIQIEPTNADALSALRSLTQLEKSLTNSAADTVSVEEHNQLFTTILGALFASIAIALIGVFISNTVVHRLKLLRRVAQAVEEGKVNERINVIGHDEIGDISKSVNSMLEIIAAEEEVTSAYQLREQFITSVSHELRNPLTEVAGWLEILRDYHGQMDLATQIKFINNAIYGCQDIMHLINNVLDAARADHQMKAPFIEEISVAQVVQAVLDHLDPRGTDTYNLYTDIQPGLVVWADEPYVRQILRNLLSNALKYSPKHSPILVRAKRLTQQTKASFPQICISVRDAGPGIPPDEIPNLFQKFKRLKRDVSGPTDGTGLGLYISKQLVEAMSGQIWVESLGVPGEGSCFSFTLLEAITMDLPSTGTLAPPATVDMS